MSGVTLDELLEEVGVSLTQLDEACTREHLRDIALFLESWRTVAPHLGLSKFQVEEVELDGTEEKEKKQKILESWRAMFAYKVNYRVLVKALLKIGRADLAEQVCHLLVQQHKEGIPFTGGGGGGGGGGVAGTNQCIVFVYTGPANALSLVGAHSIPWQQKQGIKVLHPISDFQVTL